MKNRVICLSTLKAKHFFFQGADSYGEKKSSIRLRKSLWAAYLSIALLLIGLNFLSLYFFNSLGADLKNHFYIKIFFTTQVLIDLLLFVSLFFFFFMEQKRIQYVTVMTKDLQKRSRELDTLAHVDSLTGLPNRYSFIQELEHTIQSIRGQNVKLIVGLLDIDEFSRINDTYGYKVGDELLRKIPQLLGVEYRENFYFSRLFADEFGFFMKGVLPQADVQDLLKQMIESFEQPLKILDREIKVSISIGLVSYQRSKESKDTAETLLVDCDMALYSAKTNGKNMFKFFTKEIRNNVERRHAIDYAMQFGLSHREFEVFYQPQVSVKTKKIVGLEALLRWKSPKLGSVSPDEFIPIAENNRLILKLGRFVLSQAISDFLKFKKSTGLNDLTLSVNVSTLEIRDHSYLNDLIRLVNQSGLLGTDLYLEITESIFIEKVQEVVEIINQIKKAGVKFALDDFGTGYSSMKYLKNLSVELIKIDQHFIKNLPEDPENCTIVKSMIDLAHHLNMKVLAEGVETKEQFEYLKEVGCDQAQGFYFYHPMSFKNLESLISGAVDA